MLPPGHFSAGYLLADAIVQVLHPSLSHSQIQWILFSGAFFGFAPDLDMFYAFWKEKGFHHTALEFNHRQFISHTPIVWLCLGALIMLVGGTVFWRYVGLMIWLGAWSHFVLDSTDYGIRWLYPFSKKFFSLINAGHGEPNLAVGFFKHWKNQVRQYYRRVPVTFIAEIFLVVFGVIVFLFSR